MLNQPIASSEENVPLREAIVRGDHHDPFLYLGMHDAISNTTVRAFLPHAEKVWLVDTRTDKVLVPMARIHAEGLFIANLAHDHPHGAYRLRLEAAGREWDIDDPYRFPPVLSELDLHLFAEGKHFELYRRLGAHPMTLEGVSGVAFAVWAPNARRVSVVGDFNDWDGRRHAMRCHYGAGVWEIFVPGVTAGALYKFEIKAGDGALHLKADPMARQAQCPPATASVVAAPDPVSSSLAWATRRAVLNDRAAPISILEVHLGSWRQRAEQGNRPLGYRELADELVPYATDMGFTHLELMPITEHPFDGSWGYQPLNMFAPTARYGTPADFRYFVEHCHAAGLAVILDWVPAHFPDDPHGLACFDGTHLYEHADERLGRHQDWGSLIYNFGRREVANFLIASALYWFECFGIDGIRVDAVASMLYRDYSRKPGEWLPNRHGGRENLEAVDFLRSLNHEVLTRYPGAITVAEESTAWPQVTRPPYMGGLGFSYKWNLGWMNDTLRYMARECVYRRFHQDDLTFGLLYAFHENFILPLSHDEVVHGKGSLLGKMPGDRWQKFANLRAYYAFMFTQPGKKLLFMGDEFAQTGEWNHDQSLDWHLLDEPAHQGMQTLVRDLNHLYRGTPALHELDNEATGFSWIDSHDHDASVIAYVRQAHKSRQFVVVACNFTPVVRQGYRIGVPILGTYGETLNTDSVLYGGSNVGNLGQVEAQLIPAHGFAQSLSLTLPPLATIVLAPVIVETA